MKTAQEKVSFCKNSENFQKIGKEKWVKKEPGACPVRRSALSLADHVTAVLFKNQIIIYVEQTVEL